MLNLIYLCLLWIWDLRVCLDLKIESQSGHGNVRPSKWISTCSLAWVLNLNNLSQMLHFHLLPSFPICSKILVSSSSRDLCDLFIWVLCLWGDLSTIQINIFWFQCDECGYQLYILSTLKRHISEVNDSWWEEWKKKKLFATNVTQFLTDKY